MHYLFISGTLRSGTTLLEKVLCSHDQLSVLDQPFPFLYIQAKKDFYKSIGYGDAYHYLSHCFMEKNYTIGQLNSFLNSYELSTELLRNIFSDMKTYSGQWTEVADINVLLQNFYSFEFPDVVKTLLHELRHRGDCKYCGSKEVVCEESIPFLLSNGFKCIIILRDPRDVIASLSYGDGLKFCGRERPTLFNLRNWRKSVAFALHLEEHDNFMWLKYEDLASDPQSTLQHITSFLEVPDLGDDIYANGIKDQSGAYWVPNSSITSMPHITIDGIGLYKNCLDRQLLRYIEAITYPEMISLRYDLNYELDADAISRFMEPFTITREEFSSDYSTNEVHIRQEKDRLKLILQSGRNNQANITDYYIFYDVYEKLKKNFL